MGLVPTLPVTFDVGTLVIPVLVRITKVPASPRSTGAGPGAAASALPAKAKSEAAMAPTIREFVDVTILLFSLMFFVISMFLVIS
jgi:hypothetical protein